MQAGKQYLCSATGVTFHERRHRLLKSLHTLLGKGHHVRLQRRPRHAFRREELAHINPGGTQVALGLLNVVRGCARGCPLFLRSCSCRCTALRCPVCICTALSCDARSACAQHCSAGTDTKCLGRWPCYHVATSAVRRRFTGLSPAAPCLHTSPQQYREYGPCSSSEKIRL